MTYTFTLTVQEFAVLSKIMYSKNTYHSKIKIISIFVYLLDRTLAFLELSHNLITLDFYLFGCISYIS